MSAVGIAECPSRFDVQTDVAIVGAGACGLVAALRASAQGAEVMVFERDSTPSGSTSMSSGFVPAAATRFQRAIGVLEDTPDVFAQDIQTKSNHQSAEPLVQLASETIGPALEWLHDNCSLPWLVLDDFLYPGHRYHRMHTMPEKTGEALLARLLAAVNNAGIPVVTDARVVTLFVDKNTVCGVAIERPNGTRESVACNALILACNGFAANAAMVREYIPEIADGVYHGHPGNTGDALQWGKALNAQLTHLSAYQGHGSLASPLGILITWALMMEGGIQVNRHGKRFSNEHGGYSEQAVHVLAQDGRFAWNVYDQRLHTFALTFPDYQQAFASDAIKTAASVAELASATDLPQDALATTLADVAACQQGALDHSDKLRDEFGRDFTAKPALEAPYYAVKVTGALFHTQGGLMIDRHCRVIGPTGAPIDHLFAGGGAACGVSGPDVSGYLSGNGLLTAIAFGFAAGGAAATCQR